ncbi:hypothetical protein [Bacillus sp. SJS]|uniref:hypothetical protein n=1 Tax=Bacillus sp. SJS TaxID=1423321 RepID=UPI0004DD0E80|nr:hypothetical protein [Bacillus sp. SJS]KZZ85391.1 hypothetical protein AS29_006340 [Bacillus sp. SJS]
MGKGDKIALSNDEITLNYPNASHWFLDVYYWKNDNVFQVRVFPCSKFGGSRTESPVRMIFCFENVFEKVVGDIKKDKFWETDY